MIEGRGGVERITEITAVPGLAGIHIGPVDLALDLGSHRSKSAFTIALRTIVAASHAAGLPATMHAVTAGQVTEMIELGFDELVLTSDIGLLRRAFVEEIKAAHSATAGTRTAIA